MNSALSKGLAFSSNLSEADTSSRNAIPGWQYALLMEYTSYIMIAVAVFGMTGNILIIIAYVKIGFSESINISYCALGLSDIFCVVFITWNAICFVPAFAKAALPFLPSEVVAPTGGAMGDIFCETTAWITAFISLERCLCVVFPLKIKTMVTRRRTIGVIMTIFTVTVVPLMSTRFTMFTFRYRFDPVRNRSLVRVEYVNTTQADILYQFDYFYKSICMTVFPLAIILVCSIFLAIHLHRSAAWRLGNTSKAAVTAGKKDKGQGASRSEDKPSQKSTKDMRIAKTVLSIAVAFMFLGTQNAFRFLVAMAWPEFRPLGTYRQFYRLFGRSAFLFSLINSSVNFVIYYKMGSKFRRTVHYMLSLSHSDTDVKKHPVARTTSNAL